MGVTPGFFGKLPSHGDFVARGLPGTFLDPWDLWLQKGVAASRQQLGEGWLDAFLNGPIWRFAVAPGTCGDRAWMGVLMPSVDRVGRYFPLTLAVPLPGSDAPALTAWVADAWLGQAEGAALAALDEDVDVERFSRAVEALGEPLAPAGNGAPAAGRPAAPEGDANGAPVYVQGGAPDQLQMLFPNLLHALLGDRFASYSLWWTSGSARLPPAMLACRGFPPAEGYAALLDGDYGRWGWDAGGPRSLGAEAGAP